MLNPFQNLKILFRFRIYNYINIIGLVLCLTSIFAIIRYIGSEFSTDKYISKLDRLYITTVEGYAPSGESMFIGNLNYGNDPDFKDISKASGVELSSEFSKIENCPFKVKDQSFTASICMADTNFLKTFDYHLIEGSAVPGDENRVLISSALSKKLFGKSSPINQAVKNQQLDKEYIITGVIKDNTTKASYNFDLLIITNKIEQYQFYQNKQLGILLFPNIDYRKINLKFDEHFLYKYWNMNLKYQLYPYKDLYFSKGIMAPTFVRSNATFVYLLIIAAIILFVIGIVNYTNIYTVIAMRRYKEFGIKKALGLSKTKLFIQIYTENFFICLFTIICSLTLLELTQPIINSTLTLGQIPNRSLEITVSLLALFLLPLLVSLYPFLHYQYNNPTNTLKGITATGDNSIIRNGILLIQYITTLTMLVISFYFIKQVNFMLNADLGYNTENIIKTPLFPKHMKNSNFGKAGDIITQKMNESTLFKSWTLGYSPNHDYQGGGENKFKLEGGDFHTLTVIGSNNKWMEVFGIDILEGEKWRSDSFEAGQNRLILTKSAAKLFGITAPGEIFLTPETPIWLRLSKTSSPDSKGYEPFLVIGIIDDIFSSYLGRDNYPAALYHTFGDLDENLIATVTKGKEKEAILFLEKLHNDIVGGEFSYSFLSEEIKATYKDDINLAKVYTIFTFIIIAITCIGLFGISLFDIDKRYKEIGIRKVNGATFTDIIVITSRKYVILILTAFVISTPLAIWLIRQYSENYAIKADIGVLIFILSFVITASVSFLTIFYQTWKAANTNPVETIKSE